MHYIREKNLKLENIITQNWNKITELIDSSKENNEAYRIQAERFEIQLSFDTTKKLLFWEKFCTLFKYNHQHMMDILSYVKKQTRFDIGTNKFDKGIIGTSALILCKNKNNQNFHLDITGDERKQFGMLLSIRSSSTIVCKTNSETKITSLSPISRKPNRVKTYSEIEGQTVEV